MKTFDLHSVNHDILDNSRSNCSTDVIRNNVLDRLVQLQEPHRIFQQTRSAAADFTKIKLGLDLSHYWTHPSYDVKYHDFVEFHVQRD